jgi:predicted DCC family thiol-disulfide oxidoreductase YuxK
MKRLMIIYDGQCGFCARSIDWLRRVDCFHRFEFFDSHDELVVKAKFPTIKTEDMAETMLAVTERGAGYKGFYAFRRLIWASPLLWAAAPLFYFPGSSFLGTRFYAWIARNRKNFGCRVESREN